MKYAVIGFGGRGTVYTKNLMEDPRTELVAVCDINPKKKDVACKQYGLKEENFYLSDEEFFAQGKLADLLVIATMDQDHYGHAISALKVGYDLLLEKPMCENYERCEEIYELAKKLNRKVFICHVLRYAPFFVFIKEQLDSGKFGDIVTINHTENVATWHQAHSFVRGNWRNKELATPMIVQKCCHDFDIISWFMGKKCESVSSYGSLTHFKRENAPEGSADYCFECPLQDKCIYNCMPFYYGCGSWLQDAYFDTNDKKLVREFLSDKNNPYGRCVYKCDNNVVDHQVVNMLFENGATAHLTMTAFSKECYRELHIHCTKGEIYGSMLDNKLTLNIYGGECKTVDVGAFSDGKYGHGGGDARLVHDLVEIFEGGESKGLTTIENSLQSHKIGYAAEQSRMEGGKAQKI